MSTIRGWMKFFSFKLLYPKFTRFSLKQAGYSYTHRQTSLYNLDNVHRVHRQHSISITFIRLIVSPSADYFDRILKNKKQKKEKKISLSSVFHSIILASSPMCRQFRDYSLVLVRFLWNVPPIGS